MSGSTATRTIPGQSLDDPSAPSHAAGAPSVLRFEGVSKSYQHNTARMLLRRGLLSWLKRSKPEAFFALRDVSFDLGPGLSLASWAPTARAKARCCAAPPASRFPTPGRIHARGTIAALMELGAGFHPDLTGAENVVLNASLLGLTRKQTYEQFDQIVEFSGLANFIDEPLRTYSSGMVLRLAFSVAVRVDPDILVIDEILSVGDIDFQQQMRRGDRPA